MTTQTPASASTSTSTSTFAGELMDGRSAVLRAVRVVAGADGLLLYEESPEAGASVPLDEWPWAGLVSDGMSEGVVHVRHEARGDALLTSSDQDLRALLEARGAVLHGLPVRGRRLKWIAIYGGAIAAAVGGVYALVPTVARVVAHRVPLAVEARLTLPLRDLLDEQVCTEPATRRALDALVQRLGDEPGLPAEGRVKLDVLNFEMVNALTFPGGTVVLTRGLLAKAASADEVAAVVAHELEHVRRRHVMTQVVRSSILSLGWAITIGDFSGLMVVDPQTLFQLANQRFSRDAEREADEGALGRLERAHVSARGFSAFFQRIVDERGDSSKWLATHPAHSERLARVGQQIAREVPKSLTPALLDEDWKALKAACAGRPEGKLSKIFGGDD